MPGEIPDPPNANNKEVFETMSSVQYGQYGLHKVVYTLQEYYRRKMNQKSQFEKRLERQEADKKK